MKTCTKCGVTQPLQNFHKQKVSKDGRRTNCKSCAIAVSKKYYKDNRERHIQTCKNWNNLHREKLKGRARERREKTYQYYYGENGEKFVTAKRNLYFAVFNKEVEVPKNCEICKKECEVDCFHHDPTKYLEVTWSCPECKGWLERRLSKEKLEQEAGV